ncbi:MAG TPA: PEGA domain-containing protein [Tepidisphaeraceae bacterium]|nr:PEGA domain-containing protein [Tepidisphaeraceae bacterium]
MRWIWVCGLILATGCVTRREITITARPSDAIISVDGMDRGSGPVIEKFKFKGADDVHHVSAARRGYTPQTIEVTRDYQQPDLSIQLEPQKKVITLHVGPVPGMINVDGKPVSDLPVADTTVTLPFTVDEKDQWTQHLVQVSRQGYQPVEQVVKWEDPSADYTLTLEPMKKDLSITTTPPGAEVSINGRPLGLSPFNAKGYLFPVDPAGKFVPQKITVKKPGYDPVDQTIAWDNGRTSYHIDLIPKTKTVHILTTPAAAVVKVDGKEIHSDAAGIANVELSFPPVDDKGTLKTYDALVTKQTADTEWIPEELTIAWDAGKSDYSVTLKEVKTRPVTLLRTVPLRSDEGWQIHSESLQTLAMKDVTEGPLQEPPVRITDLPKGSVIDTLAISPDGQWLLFTTLLSRDARDLRSQILMTRADGTGQPTMFGDGKTLDLTPTFTPDGTQIVFSSNRGGRHMSIWQLAANGEGGVTQLTGGDTTDLWPTVDSDPKPRLYYEALVDSRPDPRLYMTQLGTTLRTDLTQTGGTQPRVSPKADSVIFTLVNEKTGKREIYKMSDRGGGAVNLTNEPESDNFDPVWSKDGNKIAFCSDRGADSDGRHNFDVYVLDLLHPDKPVRVTTNGSWDDCPVWDPSGKYLYFRSNRGGSWAIWRVTLNR